MRIAKRNSGWFERRWRKIKKAYLDIDSSCWKCDRREYLEVDHIIPIACGGDMHNFGNLQVLCKWCHKKKTIQDLKAIVQVRKSGLFLRDSDGTFMFFDTVEEREECEKW